MEASKAARWQKGYAEAKAKNQAQKKKRKTAQSRRVVEGGRRPTADADDGCGEDEEQA